VRQTTPLCYKIQIRFAAVSQLASARFIYCPLEVNNIDSALAAGSKKTHSRSVRSQQAPCPGPRKSNNISFCTRALRADSYYCSHCTAERGNKNLVKAKAQPIIADNWDCASAHTPLPRVIAPSALFNFATAAVS